MENVIRLVNPELNEYAGIDHVRYLNEKYDHLYIKYMSPSNNRINEMIDGVQQVKLEFYRGSSLVLDTLNRWSL